MGGDLFVIQIRRPSASLLGRGLMTDPSIMEVCRVLPLWSRWGCVGGGATRGSSDLNTSVLGGRILRLGVGVCFALSEPRPPSGPGVPSVPAIP